MALNVKFLKGLDSQYNALPSKDPNTFYYLSNVNQLYLGTIKLSSADDIAEAITSIIQNREDIDVIQQQLQGLVGNGNGSIADMINAAVDPIKASVGNLDDLSTNAKTNLVQAINELHSGNNNVAEAGRVSVLEKTIDLGAGIGMTYIIQQGSTTVGEINIPKDLVVKSGQVVVNPVGYPAGTYIELTLQNAENQKIYINVGTLVDIYTAQQNATEIQLEISGDREISATIKNEAVTDRKLAVNSVTTDKIMDANVTKVKLSTTLQNSIDKADSAVQTITSGNALGTIRVDGKDIPVTGLKDGAFTELTDVYETVQAIQHDLFVYKNSNDTKVNKNTANIDKILDTDTGILAQAKEYADAQDIKRDETVLNQAKEYADGLSGNYATAAQGALADSALQESHINEGSTQGAILVKDKIVKVHGLGTAAYRNEEYFDVAGSAAAAGQSAYNNAVEYINAALTWESII